MPKICTFELYQGETQNATVDYSATSSDFGVSASSVAWTVDEGNTVSISGTPTISSNVTTGTIVADANKQGCSLIKVVATMSDSQTVTEFFKVNVINPAC